MQCDGNLLEIHKYSDGMAAKSLYVVRETLRQRSLCVWRKVSPFAPLQNCDNALPDRRLISPDNGKVLDRTLDPPEPTCTPAITAPHGVRHCSYGKS